MIPTFRDSEPGRGEYNEWSGKTRRSPPEVEKEAWQHGPMRAEAAYACACIRQDDLTSSKKRSAFKFCWRMTCTYLPSRFPPKQAVQCLTWRWRATPTPERYLVSASPSARFTCRMYSLWARSVAATLIRWAVKRSKGGHHDLVKWIARHAFTKHHSVGTTFPDLDNIRWTGERCQGRREVVTVQPSTTSHNDFRPMNRKAFPNCDWCISVRQNRYRHFLSVSQMILETAAASPENLIYYITSYDN